MLEVQTLACRRSGHMVFREISFALNAGDIMMVTGTNGSGKSSLLRVLAGLLPLWKGSVRWQGQDTATDAENFRQSLHYIGHLDALKNELTVAEMFDYWRTLYGIDHTQFQHDPFDITALRNKPVRYLSAGQKRRLALSRLMIGAAPLWLLDEPMTALDVQGQDILRKCIEAHRAKGGMAIIATHQNTGIEGALNYAMQGGAA